MLVVFPDLFPILKIFLSIYLVSANFSSLAPFLALCTITFACHSVFMYSSWMISPFFQASHVSLISLILFSTESSHHHVTSLQFPFLVTTLMFLALTNRYDLRSFQSDHSGLLQLGSWT